MDANINVEGFSFIDTPNSKKALTEQMLSMLLRNLKQAEERADSEGWINVDDLEKELDVLDY